MTRFLFGCIPASLHPCIPASLRFAVFVFTLIMSGALSDLKAQFTQCDPEADFTYANLSSCDVQFTESYNGPGTVLLRGWEFWETAGGQPNRSNLPNPVHSFRGSNVTKQVKHTIVIEQNGIVTTHVCTKTLTLCSENAECYFRYTVQNCSLTVHQAGIYTFEPGVSISVIAAPYTYVYSTPGNYTVSNTNFGVTCSRTISIGSCSSPMCCNARFTGEFYLDCSVLRINLIPECTDGSSTWTLIAPQCAKVVGTLATGAQITNINTDLYSQITVRHDYVCADGTLVWEEKSINVPPGVYIGESGQTRPLTDYECALPGSSYEGAHIVYVTGVISVDKNFTFEKTTMMVEPGLSGWDVEQTKTLGLKSSTQVAGNPECDCLWRGIYVWGTLQVYSSSIYDALYAIRPFNACSIDVGFKSTLGRNFIGIRSTEEAFSYARRVRFTTFDGTGPLKNICSLEALKADITAYPSFTNAIGTVPYSNERGFAGIYVRQNMRFDLGSLEGYLKFQNLAVGIDAYDTDFYLVASQGYFTTIRSGGYGIYGTAGVRFTDTPVGGSNDLACTGGRLPIDYERSTCGIYVHSLVPAETYSGTLINIVNTRMSAMQNGIILYSETGTFGGGTIGNPNPTGPFKGIRNNIIYANSFYEELIGRYAVGIFNASMTRSYLDLNRNDIVAGNDAYGIVSSSVAHPGISSPEYEISDSRVTMKPNAVCGIYTSGALNIIRNNNGSNPGFVGAGIYIQGGAGTATGMEQNDQNGHVAYCNDIISSSPGATLHKITAHENGFFVNNRLEGPGTGAHFDFPCGTSTLFRNQRLNQNTRGLFYSNGATTGPQGSPSNSSGNVWTGPPVTTAEADALTAGTVAATSPYYCKPGEKPVNTSPLIWFKDASGDPLFNILCPDNVSIAPPASDFANGPDSLIALGLLTYPAEYQNALEQWGSRQLYEKLDKNPAIWQNDALMAGFYGAFSTTPAAQLYQLKKGFGASINSVAGTYAGGLEQQQALVDTLTAQATGLDTSEIRMPSDEVLLASCKAAQEAAQSVMMNWKTALSQQIQNVRQAVQAVNAVSAFDSNEKWLTLFYLDYPARGLQPPVSALAELRGLAEQCPLTAGYAALSARNMYLMMTGKQLPAASCTGINERQGAAAPALPSAWLFPNPVDEALCVRTDPAVAAGTLRLTLYDHTGRPVLRQVLAEGDQRINTSALQDGLYMAAISRDGQPVLTKKIVIIH